MNENKEIVSIMAKRQRTEGQAKRDFVKLCAFFGLILAAFLFVFGGLFGGSPIGSVLEIVGKIALLIAIAFPAYEYSRGLGKVWRVIFWIALVIYVLGCVLGLLSGIGVINIGAGK